MARGNNTKRARQGRCERAAERQARYDTLSDHQKYARAIQPPGHSNTREAKRLKKRIEGAQMTERLARKGVNAEPTTKADKKSNRNKRKKEAKKGAR